MSTIVVLSGNSSMAWAERMSQQAAFSVPQVGVSPLILKTSPVLSVRDTTCNRVSIKDSSDEEAEGNSSEESG